MLTVKVYWNQQNEHGGYFYSVYSGNKYLVETDPEGAEKPYTRLLIDDGAHDIHLGKGSRTFVMNANGATVDTIIVN